MTPCIINTEKTQKTKQKKDLYIVVANKKKKVPSIIYNDIEERDITTRREGCVHPRGGDDDDPSFFISSKMMRQYITTRSPCSPQRPISFKPNCTLISRPPPIKSPSCSRDAHTHHT